MGGEYKKNPKAIEGHVYEYVKTEQSLLSPDSPTIHMLSQHQAMALFFPISAKHAIR
jgi:hypothetical protein